MTAPPDSRHPTAAAGTPVAAPGGLTGPSGTHAPSTGADLARVTLRRALDDARRKPQQRKPHRPPRRTSGSDGRDPNLLGGVLRQLVVDNQWEGGTVRGELKSQWPTLIGKERAVHWQADKFDEDTGTLRVLCDSANWAVSLQLVARAVIAEVNDQFTGAPLRQLDVRLRTGPPPPSSDRHGDASEKQTPPTSSPLRRQRGAVPSAEYRERRAEERRLRAERAAAGKPRTLLSPPSVDRAGPFIVPSAEYRAARARTTRARRPDTGPERMRTTSDQHDLRSDPPTKEIPHADPNPSRPGEEDHPGCSAPPRSH
ncbi:DUF721 domain-containing protein [Streptomyces niveus]|uniref:DUF721 domain-containing protein n=1 Tax=Streptomyces niveus TaxID=193462 RepID=UPI0034404C38